MGAGTSNDNSLNTWVRCRDFHVWRLTRLKRRKRGGLVEILRPASATGPIPHPPDSRKPPLLKNLSWERATP